MWYYTEYFSQDLFEISFCLQPIILKILHHFKSENHIIEKIIFFFTDIETFFIGSL